MVSLMPTSLPGISLFTGCQNNDNFDAAFIRFYSMDKNVTYIINSSTIYYLHMRVKF